MGVPEWLSLAFRHHGVTERAGREHNAEIIQFSHDTGNDWVTSDETAWCAAFVGSVLERSGIASSRSLLARSYQKWGEEISEACPGAIAVFSRGTNPAQGHVAFLLSRTRDKIRVIGGNQSDQVSVADYDAGRLLSLRWPIGVVRPGLGESCPEFITALHHVLRHEGAWSNDPHDPGGETNFGVTLEVFARHLGESIDGGSRARLVAALKAIRPETVREIYHHRYWQLSQAGLLPPGLNLMHFDCAVNQGPARAARFLQASVNTGVDGEIGPLTLSAAHRANAPASVATYAALRRKHYHGLDHFWRFGRGWLARLDDITAEARQLLQSSETEQKTNRSDTRKEENMMSDGPKWWGESLTIWGAIITSLSTVLPLVGPLVGIDISAGVIAEFGDQVTRLLQIVGGITGTLMTVYGRLRASSPLAQRAFALKL